MVTNNPLQSGLYALLLVTILAKMQGGEEAWKVLRVGSGVVAGMEEGPWKVFEGGEWCCDWNGGGARKVFEVKRGRERKGQKKIF